MPATWLACADREQASAAVAERIADALEAALQRRPAATLVVSGGSTPARCLELLSAADIDWSRVSVLPSDERCVAEDHPDSNAGMIRRCLLRGRASAAHLEPLFRADGEAANPALLRPFDCVLLGMGADGHFASLFPDFDGLAAALDPDGLASAVPVRTAASPHPRVSLTLSALADTPALLLLIFGADKRAVFEAAATGDRRYPVSALLALDDLDLDLTTAWAP